MTRASRPTVHEVGEFGFIERLVALIDPPRPDTVIGAGEDDAAVLRLPDGSLQLATLDALVDGVHFILGDIAPRELGYRLAAVNLSDIAAMGGRPTHGIAGMVAPADLDLDMALEIVEGLSEGLHRSGADLVGGNVAGGRQLTIDLALLGETDESRLLTRAGAQPGDAVLVTGSLGGAAAARALWEAELSGRAPASVDADLRSAARSRLIGPVPRLDVGWLLGPAGASAAIDVSDGLAADIGHLCERSSVGVLLDAEMMPIDPSAQAIAGALGADALHWALEGGEDYEIVFTAPRPLAGELCRRVSIETGVPITEIGRVVASPERRIRFAGGIQSELAGGWRHFN